MGANRAATLDKQAVGLVEKSLTVLLKYNEDRVATIGRDSNTLSVSMPSQLAELLAKAST
jgi:hypothetical protein